MIDTVSSTRACLSNGGRSEARQVNSALVLLYWRVGKRIRQDILKEKRAEYGGRIVSALREFQPSPPTNFLYRGITSEWWQRRPGLKHGRFLIGHKISVVWVCP